MYRFIEDLTSDVMFEVEGKDLAELLEQSSLALFEVICQIEKIRSEKSISIKIEAEAPEQLLHEWLSYLLTESDVNEMFFSKFEIQVFQRNRKLIAEGKAYGEAYSREKSGTVVKGITYYRFKVEKTEKGYTARVACDI
jgi:SHS2 domain-containing protein